MVAALWILVIGVTTVQKQRLLSEAAHELAQMNRAVAEQVTTLFRAADTDLRTIDLWLQSHPGVDPRGDARFVGLVNELRRSSGGIVDIRLTNRKGDAFSIPTLDGRAQMNVGEQPFFRSALVDAARELKIGEPLKNRATERAGIPVYRRLEVPAGDLVLGMATVELDGLTVLHEKLRIKPNGTIAVIRTDGVVLSRVPFETGFIGRSVANTPSFKSEFGVKESGVFSGRGSNSDGLERLVSYERLGSQPVTVLVSQGAQDILSTFERRRAWAVGILGVLTGVVLAFTWALHRSLLTLQAARRDMQRLATSDSLTGVASRRAFLAAAEREFARARRYRRPCTLLMLDLDHFKRINDGHGHAAGDAVLRDCAAAWSALLRDQDVLGRLGGEEFCAVLPETPLENGRLAAERMRLAVAGLAFNGRDGRFSVTVSIGFTEVSQADLDLAAVIERADAALYRAKKAGRNRVEGVEHAELEATTKHA